VQAQKHWATASWPELGKNVLYSYLGLLIGSKKMTFAGKDESTHTGNRREVQAQHQGRNSANHSNNEKEAVARHKQNQQ
jgi:hypothetical protein